MKDWVREAERLRADFPILSQRHPSGAPLVYLDNAATAQKPQVVIETLARFLKERNSNIHRGVHWLSQEATALYEAARETVAEFIGAESAEEIVFVRGATEGINLIAQGLRRAYFGPGDEILLTQAEHHANIVPWQLVEEELSIKLRPIPLREDGSFDWVEFHAALSPHTRLIAITAMSNVLGTEMPIAEIAHVARQRGIPVLVDACQAVVHRPISVKEWGVDFLVFSGHKLYGPTGIGVVYLRRPWGEKLPPYQGGGDMIRRVSWEKTLFAPPPAKFEAGTPAIAEAIAFAEAIRYLHQRVGWDFIQAYEQYLSDYAEQRLGNIPTLKLYGTARPRGSLWSFTLEEVHPHDAGTFLDQAGIAVRVGHHCAQPLMDAMGVPATIRASFAFYNLPSEIDHLAHSLERVVEFFSPVG
ncbi:MAG: SufS family cysteine desulfurase [Bacteroidia bacterium]|nr:SufS family cysteine desulfurase [Bacteroidia bacterium]MCX7652485.1 SufS family cysteine desulfurase [Bacteroidia bacterium]MDW8416692.1 SufS family cysteine desulfurase [Bacteroidia bacterium]